jgi:hypothetical protein
LVRDVIVSSTTGLASTLNAIAEMTPKYIEPKKKTGVSLSTLVEN